MNKLNVLILVDKFDYHGSYINGPTRYFSWLMQGLDKSKFNPHLYTLRAKGQSHHVFQQYNIEVKYLNLSKYNPFTLVRLIQVIVANKIDILHLTGYGSTTFGRLAGAICRRPCIVHEHWVDPSMGGIQIWVDRCLAGFATSAIACSEYAKRFLVTKKGISDRKIVVVPNGVPLDLFRSADARQRKQRRKELAIDDDITVIGIIGMLHANKGHRYFIEAASLVSAENRKVKFLIVGDGESRQELEEQVSRLGLQDYVMFMGHQDDIPVILKMLDIFVMASISETAGLSLLEAMAAEKAIITTDSGGPSEIVKDRVTGLVVPVKDAKAIAKEIQYLIDNPCVRELLAKNAASDSEQYDIRCTVEKIEQLYEQTFAGS